jgi:hypothetical protein
VGLLISLQRRRVDRFGNDALIRDDLMTRNKEKTGKKKGESGMCTKRGEANPRRQVCHLVGLVAQVQQ